MDSSKPLIELNALRLTMISDSSKNLGLMDICKSKNVLMAFAIVSFWRVFISGIKYGDIRPASEVS